MLSVIIPVYNEEEILSKNSREFENLSRSCELIFVDGGSSDRSAEVASSYGDCISCARGRAIQMNCGAGRARYETLLFLHADNIISSQTLLTIEKNVERNGLIGGCLTQRIDKAGIIYRIIENQGNMRARLSKVFYGDQGIFVKKSVFLKMGGFPQVPIMEDVLFTRKLRREGNTAALRDRIIVSPRRWEKRGIVRTVLLYNFIITLFKLGVRLDKIKLLYEDLR